MGRYSKIGCVAVLAAWLAGQGGCALNNLELGNQAYDRGEFAKARQYHELALANARTLGDRLGESSSLNNLGNVCQAIGDYVQARNYYEQSLAIDKTLGDRDGEGKSLSNLGIIAKNLGDYTQAMEYNKQSLAIAMTLGDRSAESRSLTNFGVVYLIMGDYAQAYKYFEQSLVLNKVLGDQSAEAKVLIDLGNVSYNLGDYMKSMKYYEQSLAIAKLLGERMVEGRILGNLGAVSITLGDYASGRKYNEQALAIAKTLGDRKGEEASLSSLGSVSEALSDYAKAREYYEQSLIVTKALGDQEVEKINFGNLGNMDLEQGLFREALASYSQFNEPVYLGFYHLRLGEFNPAREQFQKSLGKDETSHNAEFLLADYIGLGLSYEGLKQWQESLRYFQKAVDLIETQRAQLDPAARHQFIGGKVLIFKRLEAYEGLARVALANGDAADGLHWAEHTKARLFIEALARKEGGNGLKLPEALETQENQVNTRLASVYKQQEAAFNAKNTALFQSLESKLIEAKREQEAFVAQLRREQPAYAAVAYPQPLHLNEIQLKPHEVLLEYEMTETATLAWLVRDGKIVKTLNLPVSRKELSQRVEDYRKGISTEGRFDTAAVALGRGLYRDLFAPFAAELNPSDELIIVPDDALATIPFEALIVDEAEAPPTLAPSANIPAGGVRAYKRVDQESQTAPGGLQYLGDKVSIRYAQSATALVQTRQFQQDAPNTRKALLVVADPVFDQADASERLKANATQLAEAEQVRSAIKNSLRGRGAFERLPSTDRAAQDLARKFGGAGQVDILKGFNANEESVTSHLRQGYRYGVFATHGVLLGGPDFPYIMEPALVLSQFSADGKPLPAEDTGSPGFLTLSEVMGLQINSDLLALTACETGLGRNLLGEGAMSMGRGFQYAGVKSVLMSLWKVEDSATNLLTDRLFARLREGKGKLESLRLARADLWRQGYREPKYWAPFILVGEP